MHLHFVPVCCQNGEVVLDHQILHHGVRVRDGHEPLRQAAQISHHRINFFIYQARVSSRVNKQVAIESQSEMVRDSSDRAKQLLTK